MPKKLSSLLKNPDIVVFVLPVSGLLLLGIIEILETVFLIKSRSPSADYYFIQLTYLFAGWPILFFSAILVPAKTSQQVEPILQNDQIIFLCILFATASLLMIAFDRVIIQKVDYSDGIVSARESWRAGAQQRNAPSSILSVLGNLLYPFIFVAAILLAVSYETARWRVVRLAIVVIIIVVQMFITGGRTSILLLCILLTGAFLMRKTLRKPTFPKGIWLPFGLTILISALLVGTIFSMRATHNQMGEYEYAESLLQRHHGDWSDDGANVAMLQGTSLATTVYFIHTKWILNQVTENSEGLNGYALLYQVRAIFVSRLCTLVGMDIDSPTWTHAGNWLSLPGQAFHDFGGVGVILTSIVMWSLLAAVLFAVKRDMSVAKRPASPALVLIGSVVIGMFVWSPVYSMFDIVEGLYLLFIILVLITAFKLLSFGRAHYKTTRLSAGSVRPPALNRAQRYGD
jgi:hypothetical protein